MTSAGFGRGAAGVRRTGTRPAAMRKEGPRMSDVLDRFLRYCAVPSQSNPLTADDVPSTASQLDMANVVARDLRSLAPRT